MSYRNTGVTLIELLVAIALMIILTGSISYVFITSRSVFSQSEATIQVYQNARNAFDIIEREVSIAVKTHDMDYFIDEASTANGHFDAGEQCFGLNVNDPGANPTKPDKNPNDYAYAMTIYGQEHPDPRYPARAHRSDMLYFKSLTTIGGKTRSSLILYKIDRTTPTKPILKKYVLFRSDISGTGFAQDPPEGSGQDLCMYVTDMKIEYYFDNVLDGTPPQFYEVPANSKKIFCYLGTSGQGKTDVNGVFSTTDFDDPTSDKFGQLSARDRIFLYGNPPVWRPVENCTDYIIDSMTTTGELTFSKMGIAVPADASGVSFRAGYLPPALRFTLKIMDTKGLQVRTIKRVVKIRSK
jgi:type II secretory pathway pseudopilin PulG